MDISKHSNGVKISTGKVSVFINPTDEIESGVVIYTNSTGDHSTNDNRLVIEGPGEYEFQGVYIKGLSKEDSLAFVISYDEREVYYTDTNGISSIPDDSPYDAVILEVKEGFDINKSGKISYPTVYVDSDNVLSEKIDAETVKSLNLKKITPGENNIFILQ